MADLVEKDHAETGGVTLLVLLEQAAHRGTVHRWGRGRQPKRCDQVVLSGLLGETEPERRCPGSRHHPHRHRMTVAHPTDDLDTVTDCVSVIEDGAPPALPWIRQDHIGLDPDGCRYDQIERGGLTVLFEEVDQTWVGDQSRLQRLCQSLAPHRLGKPIQHVDIDQNHRRVPEGADQVFPTDVDPGLATDRCVYRGEQGRRDQDGLDTPQPGGGGEPGEVRHRPATNTDDGVVPSDPDFGKPAIHLGEDLDRLGGIPVGKDPHVGFDPAGRQ